MKQVQRSLQMHFKKEYELLKDLKPNLLAREKEEGEEEEEEETIFIDG